MATATTYGARDHARAQEGTRAEAMPVVPASRLARPALRGGPPGVGGDRGGRQLHAQGARPRHRAAPDRPRAATPARISCCTPTAALGAAQRRRHRQGPVERLPRRGPACSCPTRAGSSPRSSPTPRGRHDALCGTSTLVRNTERYGDGTPQSASPAGRELFKLAAAKNGLEPRDLPPSRLLLPGRAGRDGRHPRLHRLRRPRRLGDLRAEQDADVLIANVPHPLDPRPRLRQHAAGGAGLARRADRARATRCGTPPPRAAAPSSTPPTSSPPGGSHDRGQRRRREHRRTAPGAPPGPPSSAPGETLTIIDLDGNQAVDFLVYDAHDTAERYSAPDTIPAQGNIFLTTGSVLLSNEGTPLMTVVADDVRPPRHDRRRLLQGVQHPALRPPHQVPARLRGELPRRGRHATASASATWSPTSTGS